MIYLIRGYRMMNTVSSDSGVSAGNSSGVSGGNSSVGSDSLQTACATSSSVSSGVFSMEGTSGRTEKENLFTEDIVERPRSRGALPYMCPFENLAPNDPTFDQMKKIVCLDRLRPPIEQDWYQSQVRNKIYCLRKFC